MILITIFCNLQNVVTKEDIQVCVQVNHHPREVQKQLIIVTEIVMTLMWTGVDALRYQIKK